MNARLRRLQSDYDRICKDFSDHPYIIVRNCYGDPPEAYDIVYRIPGIRMEGQNPVAQSEHYVRITLPANYPRQKPVCTIRTPIWHPNFRDGQICIGDIWGAGETVSDIIVHIGDMIQYRIWNTRSPLSADAAHWAEANKTLFPIGNIELWKPDTDRANTNMTAPQIELEPEIQILDEENLPTKTIFTAAAFPIPPTPVNSQTVENDIEISADELDGIQWTPAPPPNLQYQPNIQYAPVAPSIGYQAVPLAGSRQKMDFSAIFRKGILFGLIGGAVAWLFSEIFDPSAPFYQYAEDNWESLSLEGIKMYMRIGTGVFNAFIAGLISLLLALGEEIYRGARDRIIKVIAIRFGIGFGFGFIGGFIAQMIYSAILSTDATESMFNQILARSIAWTFVGISIGLSQGLFPKNGRKIKNGFIGGSIGGFLGGLLFDIIGSALMYSMDDSGIVSRGIAIIVIGGLTGFGIGLVEQLTKQSWLKVVRGDFEGKEFILHQPVVTIGSMTPSQIVLFKDKLVSPQHAAVQLDRGRHMIIDQGSANGTYVNGARVSMQSLREGDNIAVGNTVMIYHTKEVRP